MTGEAGWRYSVGMHNTAFISLGGNLGDVRETFRNALGMLSAEKGVNGITASGLYRTEPQGDPDQPWFFNQVGCLACSPDMRPEELLHILQGIESRLGRVRDSARRFGPRSIDLDLLLFDSVVLSTAELILPHPRMRERAFVLVPLLDLEPELHFPDGTKAAEVLAGLNYTVTGNAVYQTA